MIKKILHALYLFTALFVTWYLLSGMHEPLYLVFGVISSALAVTLAIRMEVVDREGHPFHLALTAPLYWGWLFTEIVRSGINVTRAIWNPRYEVRPYFAWIPLTQKSDLGRTIFANSATLTPGSVCINIEPKRIFIHSLDKQTIRELHEGEMDRRVTRLVGETEPAAPSAAATSHNEKKAG